MYESTLLVTTDGPFDLAFDPAGDLLTLDPGDSVWIGGYLAAVAISGGEANAFSTLTTSLVDPGTGAQLTPTDGIVATTLISEPIPAALLALSVVGFAARTTPHRVTQVVADRSDASADWVFCSIQANRSESTSSLLVSLNIS